MRLHPKLRRRHQRSDDQRSDGPMLVRWCVRVCVCVCAYAPAHVAPSLFPTRAMRAPTWGWLCPEAGTGARRRRRARSSHASPLRWRFSRPYAWATANSSGMSSCMTLLKSTCFDMVCFKRLFCIGVYFFSAVSSHLLDLCVSSWARWRRGRCEKQGSGAGERPRRGRKALMRLSRPTAPRRGRKALVRLGPNGYELRSRLNPACPLLSHNPPRAQLVSDPDRPWCPLATNPDRVRRNAGEWGARERERTQRGPEFQCVCVCLRVCACHFFLAGIARRIPRVRNGAMRIFFIQLRLHEVLEVVRGDIRQERATRHRSP